MRIRTVKPEFWTDEVMVQMPFEARLLFVGLWNLSDDYGYLEDQPDRIKMQVFPSDDVCVWALIDILEQSGRLERLLTEDGMRVIHILNFQKHQKIDNRAKPRLSTSPFKKRALPAQVRAEVAKKYGLEKPGDKKIVACYYCEKSGEMIWWSKGWVTMRGLEFDHFEPEAAGGPTTTKNIVIACRGCNRSKGCTENGATFLSHQLPPIPTEETGGMGKEGKGKEWNGGERKKQVAQPATLIPEDLKAHEEAIKDWLAYKREKGQTYKPKGMEALWRSVRGIPGGRVREAVDHCMGNNYSGLFPAKGATDGKASNRLRLDVHHAEGAGKDAVTL